MVDFLFGKDMKKFLITIFPLCVILFVSIWISWGLKAALVFFGSVLFIVTLAFGLSKWIEFVDKHIKD
jgi:Ca2+/H+ antiporter